MLLPRSNPSWLLGTHVNTTIFLVYLQSELITYPSMHECSTWLLLLPMAHMYNLIFLHPSVRTITVKHRPSAFLTSPLPYGTDGMSLTVIPPASTISLSTVGITNAFKALLCLPLLDFATVQPPYLLLAIMNSIVPSGLC